MSDELMIRSGGRLEDPEVLGRPHPRGRGSQEVGQGWEGPNL